MKTLRVAVPALLMLALSACESGGDVSQPTNTDTSSSSSSSSSESTSSTDSSSSSSSSSSSDTTSSSSSDSSSSSSSSDGGGSGSDDTTKLFGETHKFSDGLEVTAAKPVTFTPRDGALGMEGYKYAVKINFTSKNGGSKANKTYLMPDVTSGSRKGERLYDSSNGCGSAPSSAILPGKTLTFVMCYAVDDANDLTVSVSPDYRTDYFWVSKK